MDWGHSFARRATRWFGWSALALAILPILLVVLGKGFGLARPGGTFLDVTAVGALLSAALSAAAFAYGRWAFATLARSDAGQLTLRWWNGTTEPVPIDRVTNATVLPEPPGRAQVELTLDDGRTLVATTSDRETAKRMLADAGLELRRRAARIEVARSSRWLALLGLVFGSYVAGPALLPIGHATAGGAISWIVLVATAFLTAMVATHTPTVTVGLDGITIDRRFLTFEGVVEATAHPRGFALRRADGTEDVVALFRLATTRRIAQRDAILHEVKAALAHRASDAVEAHAASALARAGRTVGEWRAAVKALAQGNDYRSAHLPIEQLAQTVARADASAEERIGAALALIAGQPDVAPRIRVAAETCADPKVRIALERVADGRDEDVEVNAAIAEALAIAQERTRTRT